MSENMPKPSVETVILGGMLAGMEREAPGFIDRFIADIEDEEAQATVIRLRGPKTSPQMLDSLNGAATWGRWAKLLITSKLSREAPVKRGKKRAA